MGALPLEYRRVEWMEVEVENSEALDEQSVSPAVAACRHDEHSGRRDRWRVVDQA